METKLMKLSDLKGADYNPRKELKPGDPEFEKLKHSIETWGVVEPIIWNRQTNTIVGGHQRLAVLHELGYEDTEVVVVDLDEANEKALNIALNKISGDWDAEKLEDLLRELDNDTDLDVTLTGFDLDELDTLFSGAMDDLDDNIKTSKSSNSENTEDDEEDTDDEDEDEEDLAIDINRKEKYYGLPYQGSKSKIADLIINILPDGNRLVDLFGGGGAITHCALLYNKWNKILYNDINPLITTFFKDAIDGKYVDEHRVIDRETFKQLKDTDPYVKYCWSFGSNGKDYLWSPKNEKYKIPMCHALLDEDLTDRRKALKQLLKILNNNENQNIKKYKGLESLQSLQRLQSLQSLQRLQRLQNLENLEISNISYEQYTYQDGDIVYCDVPYESDKKVYGVKFDNKQFYEWAKTRDFQVFFSSYEISDNSFYKVKIKSVDNLLSHKNIDTRKQVKLNEYLYSNKPILEDDTNG